jgi:methylmalonyl-CoA mutase C-terminal domain/subunit
MSKIRVLIAILGMDQHELGAVAISRLFRDGGMEVIYAGRFNLPPMIVKMAVEEDVDVIGLSCHSWEYLYYIPELITLLKERELSIPVILGGSVITSQDQKSLMAKGVAAAFGPTSSTEEIIQTINRMVGEKEQVTIPGSEEK